ncbi:MULTISPECIES: hypothetical protein [unclassified Bacillus (in: firmicutes)]|uniref:hypothetical protein n=1 Tax=unclassified Bacillus (in: firmicutes) TaxID=185979 RepID=UPI001BE981BB|nr:MULTISPECIES: hypothetical protein [unclassified Bacillus (in: firmicutes)]
MPTKQGPRIKLKSLKILVVMPPLTLHHLYGIAKKLSINTSNEASIATGEYLLKAVFGRKREEHQEITNNPILINIGDTKRLPLSSF